MRYRVKYLFVLLAVLIVLPTNSMMVWAQATAQISGLVKDSSGSVLPGAEVTATETETGAVRNTVSNETGAYVLPNLPLGPYKLEMALPGFRTFVQTGIVLQVNSNPTINVTLEVGQRSEQVEVQANAALVETETTGIGHVIENTRILELPLNGRLATDLIPLVGGTIPQGVAGTSSFPNTVNIVVAGGQAFGNAFWLDGGLHINFHDSTNLPFPFPDALQEFKVETSSLTAQNGLKSGASINAVTKSGTNAWHGDAFEFVRNGILNARNFFAPTRDTLKRNQFGGTLGGPIIKDRLFIFGGSQNTITRQDPNGITAFVPTQAMLNGDFTACPASIPSTLKSQYPNNIIPVSLYNKSSLLLASKLPGSSDPCGRTTFGLVTQINEYQGLGRVDYQMNAKSSLFGRYMATTYYRPPAYAITPNNILSTAQGALDDLAQSVIVGNNYVFSPATVNQFRAAYSRVAVTRSNSDHFSGCDLGVRMYCGFLPHQSSYSVTGGFTVGGGTIVKGTNRINEYQVSDDISVLRGAHQFGFGVTALKQKSALVTNVYAQGGFTFASMSQFLLGQLNTFVDSMPNALPINKSFFGSYARDTWKINPRLTANFGVRWDPFFPPQILTGEMYNFSYANFVAGVKSQQYVNAPAGFTYPGDPGFPNGKAGVNKQWNLFAPRIGLAWDPKGDGKTTIRAGYGTAYDFVSGNLFVNPANAPPFGDTVMTAGAPFDNPFAPNPGGNIFPITFDKNVPFVPYGTFIVVKPDLRTTSVHQWNLALQRQVGADWLLSATYIGSETEHLWYSYQLNPGTIVPCPGGAPVATCNTQGNLNQRRVLSLTGNPSAQYIGFLDTFDDGGTASYNGLILAVQKRLSKGVSIDTNYTWSHCIGDLAIGQSTGNAGAGVVDPNNRRLDRGNCQSTEIGGTFSSDRRHIFNLSVVGQAPTFANPTLKTLVTGWQLASIYRVTSGGFFTVGAAGDAQLSGSSVQRPVQVLKDPLCPHPNVSCWINPAAFATPAPGTLSTMGKDNIPGPGFWQLDLALSRNFKVREKRNLQLRVEAFNVTNSFRAGVAPPSTAAGGSGLSLSFPSASFGQITSALDPRIMQASMKFSF
jgi:hypothetical protein